MPQFRVEPLNSEAAFFVDFTMYTQTRINAFQYFFRSERVYATIKKRQRGFPLHFISFKMTAKQETQVNASILSKTLKEYSILYAMTFLRNSFSLTIICLKMLYWKNFNLYFTFVNCNARLLQLEVAPNQRLFSIMLLTKG